MPKLNQYVNELLAVVRDVVDPLGVDYAIGGALAMASHGYSRQTSDVDLFVAEKDRGKVLHALRAAGLHVSDVMRPHHYIAEKPEHSDDPDARIDVMVPAGEPDITAIEWPDRRAIVSGGAKLNVVEANLLAMMKFYSDRDDDERDLKQLYERGIFEPDKVRKMIASIDNEDGDEVAAWDATIASFHRKRRSRPRPTKKPVR
jgi:hypothetical protein